MSERPCHRRERVARLQRLPPRGECGPAGPRPGAHARRRRRAARDRRRARHRRHHRSGVTQRCHDGGGRADPCGRGSRRHLVLRHGGRLRPGELSRLARCPERGATARCRADRRGQLHGDLSPFGDRDGELPSGVRRTGRWPPTRARSWRSTTKECIASAAASTSASSCRARCTVRRRSPTEPCSRPCSPARCCAAIRGELTEYANFPLSWPYVEDAARIALAVLDRGRAGKKYLAAGGPDDVLSLAGFCNLGCAAAGVAHRVRDLSLDDLTSDIGPMRAMAEASLPHAARRSLADQRRTRHHVDARPRRRREDRGVAAGATQDLTSSPT